GLLLRKGAVEGDVVVAIRPLHAADLLRSGRSYSPRQTGSSRTSDSGEQGASTVRRDNVSLRFVESKGVLDRVVGLGLADAQTQHFRQVEPGVALEVQR